jgi:hypothetical protein
MNNREIVTLIYIGLFVLFAVSVRGARSALLQMLKLLVTSKVGLTLAIFLAYTAAVVFMMSRLGLWDDSPVGSTVLWTAKRIWLSVAPAPGVGSALLRVRGRPEHLRAPRIGPLLLSQHCLV